MLTTDDIGLLACPACRGAVRFQGEIREERLYQGSLTCASCATPWPVRSGLAKLYDEDALTLKERLIRLSYDKFGRIHDPLVRIVMPLLRPETAAENRERYLARLELASLRPHSDGTPVRILEVGVGSGDDIPAVRRQLTPDLEAEVWGVDVSVGMLRVLRPRLDRPNYANSKVLMGDAHALPFIDGAFDRVFHVGAANSYRDPSAAIREMVRVAIPGSPIVIVDEWLDRSTRPRLRDRIVYHALTAYDWNLPHPVSFVPDGSTDVRMEQLNPVFYCMSFRAASRDRSGTI
jgi:uncharacterized protein YbaR (Trm112 family)